MTYFNQQKSGEGHVAATLREHDIAQIRRTLGALTSAVKCGEAWTPTLSVEVQLAHGSLRSLEDTVVTKSLTDKVMTGGLDG